MTMWHHVGATCLLAVALAGLTTAQTDFFETKYTFATGEQLEFVKGSASIKYYPAKSTNCSRCFVSFKLGALSELDAFGQPISAHVIPDLSNLTPSVVTGRRISGDSEYEYVTMTFSGANLSPALSKEACPTLESILSRAVRLGVQAPEGSAIANLGGLSSLYVGRSAPKLTVESGLLPAGLGLTRPDPAAFRAAVTHPDAMMYSGRRLSQAESNDEQDLWDDAAGVPATVEYEPAEVPATVEYEPAGVPATVEYEPLESAAAVPPATFVPKPVQLQVPSLAVAASKPASNPVPAPALVPKSAPVAQPVRLPVVVEAPAAAPALAPQTSHVYYSSLSNNQGAESHAVPQTMLLDHTTRSEPSIKLTFMFGFTANKTFPYGTGRFVSAPRGSIKWSLEAANWPFCSLYNTLKLELVAVSTVRQNEAQITSTGSTAPELDEEDEIMLEGAFGSAASRRLQQYADFFEPEVASPEAAGVNKRGAAGLPAIPYGNLGSFAGLAGLPGYGAHPGLAGLPPFHMPQEMDPMAAVSILGAVRKPAQTVSTAKLLVGPGLAAAIELPTYAFASTNFTGESNVSIVLASNSSDGAARFSLTFGYFPTGLYYDPTIYFSDTFDMQLAASDVSILPTLGVNSLAAANCPPGEEQCRARRSRGATSSATSVTPALAYPAMTLLALLAALLFS